MRERRWAAGGMLRLALVLAVHASAPSRSRGRFPLALRGGGGGPREEAGVSQALLEPSFAAANPRRLRASEARDFDDELSSRGRGSTVKRLRRSDDSQSDGLGGFAAREFGELCMDMRTPERPGFLASLPALPQYEPESDELAQDNDDIPLDADTQDRLAGASYEEWLQAQDEHQARLQVGRRHKETDYGQGYLEGRFGKDDGMGWLNYKAPGPSDLAAPERLSLEPVWRLNRHLWHAAEHGDVQLIKLLLQAGAQVDSSNNESFLPATVRFGLPRRNSLRPPEPRKTVAYGYRDEEQSVAQIAVYRWAPLHWAANGGHQEAVSMLLRPRERGGGGAALNCSDWKLLTPMHLAAAGGFASVVDALLQAGAPATVNDTVCNTPLHMAAWEGHEDAMRVLLNGGALVNAANLGSSTPLHWAAQQNQLAAVKLLLLHGADPNVQDEDDMIALNLAETSGFEELADTIATAMDLVKVGPADMDSFSRQIGAKKAMERIAALERRLAGMEAAGEGHVSGVKDGGAGEDSQGMEEVGPIRMHEAAALAREVRGCPISGFVLACGEHAGNGRDVIKVVAFEDSVGGPHFRFLFCPHLCSCLLAVIQEARSRRLTWRVSRLRSCMKTSNGSVCSSRRLMRWRPNSNPPLNRPCFLFLAATSGHRYSKPNEKPPFLSRAIVQHIRMRRRLASNKKLMRHVGFASNPPMPSFCKSFLKLLCPLVYVPWNAGPARVARLSSKDGYKLAGDSPIARRVSLITVQGSIGKFGDRDSVSVSRFHVLVHPVLSLPCISAGLPALLGLMVRSMTCGASAPFSCGAALSVARAADVPPARLAAAAAKGALKGGESRVPFETAPRRSSAGLAVLAANEVDMALDVKDAMALA